jgi:DNA-binding GntR family transcriptional regulator
VSVPSAPDRPPGGPPWRRIYTEVRAQIIAGDLQPGEIIGPADQMAADYGVNRNTVLKALAELQREGYAVSVRGWGILVNDPEHWPVSP